MIDRQNLKSTAARWVSVAMTLAAVLIQSQPAAARQFDCRNAEATSERMICRNDRLGALDEQMSRLYGELMQAYDSRGQSARLCATISAISSPSAMTAAAIRAV